MYAFIHFLKQPLQASLNKQPYNVSVEQYRGLCALLVMIAHGTVHEAILVDNFTWPEYFNYLGAGYLSVIMFFCLSGYVIGISNNVPKLNIPAYIKKRFIRLYPVYIAVFILCIVIAQRISWLEFFGNLFMLQSNTPYGYFTIPTFVNYPTWSLNYEIIYYTLFIPLFFIKPRVWQLIAVMLPISILLIECHPAVQWFVLYFNGFYFWIFGLMIGWQLINAGKINKPIHLLSLLFLHLCQHHLGIGMIVLNTLGISTNTAFNWLFDLPFCLMVMATLTNMDSRLLRINKAIVYLTPLIVFLYLIMHNRLFENERWIMCSCFWLLSVLLFKEEKISAFLLKKLTGIGKISYALYLLHVPVALLIKKLIFIDNKPIEVAVKYMLWIALTFAAAIFFDLVYQPKIKKLFYRATG